MLLFVPLYPPLQTKSFVLLSIQLVCIRFGNLHNTCFNDYFRQPISTPDIKRSAHHFYLYIIYINDKWFLFIRCSH